MAMKNEAACCEHCAEKTNFEIVDDDAGGGLSRRLLICGAVVFAAGMVFEFAGGAWWGGAVRLVVFLAAYILVGGEILLGAARGIGRGHVFDENFLMAVASIGAFAIGEMPEGVAVMLFYRIGEAFEDRAVDHSTRAISALMEVRPEHAYVLVDGARVETDPKSVAVGSLISVRPGERVPLDGIVRDGISSLDTSALTGESMPRRVEAGDEALAGAVNTSGLLTIEVTRPFGESAVAKILKLVQEAGSHKAPAENFITKFARYYTPIVVVCAVILAFIPPLFIDGAVFSDWVQRALIFLVISCPCALVISIPLSYFGGIGGASRQGVLVKGGNHLETLARVDTVVFDKTGTLTKGKIRVSGVYPAAGVTESELLRLAAAAEQASTHPIAQAIIGFAREKGFEIPLATDVSEAAGRGAIAFVDGRAVNQNGLQSDRIEIRAGSERLLAEAGIALPEESATQEGAGTACHISIGDRYAGSIRLVDELRPDSKSTTSALRAAGVRKLYMLTGDNAPAAAAVADEIGLDGYFAGLLPHQKVEQLEALAAARTAQNEKPIIAFVGDGINDAPVLARADIGIAMGGIGSDAAIEAADAVIMADEPSRLATAIRVAKKTHAIVLQNIVFALGVKGVLLILGALGLANMWMAVFGDVGVAAICVLNSLRALRN
jgi:Cd2+/Zn2+-exporting ATPase